MAKAVKTEMSETQMTNAICKFLHQFYPDVEWRTDKDGNFASRTALWAKGAQKGKKGFPDLIIKEKRKGYKGLVLELKKDGVRVFKQDGTLYKDEHLEEQKEWLEWFEDMGCKTGFSVGLQQTIRTINEYLR